jgi:hypothetical protein
MAIKVWWNVDLNHGEHNYTVEAESVDGAVVAAAKIWREGDVAPKNVIRALAVRYALANEVRGAGHRPGK